MVKRKEKQPPENRPKRAEVATTVRLSEVFNSGLRMEASAFNIEARHAVDQMRRAGLPLVSLYGGENSLCNSAHNAFRFKRIYVKPEFGIPFLSSSDIISMRPNIERYISRCNTKQAEELLVGSWQVLISRSGTIGNVALSSETIAGKAVSEDVIRMQPDDPDTAGYITAFLRSRFGRLQLTQATYGSVVQHIEPEHLKKVWIPDLPAIQRIEIGRKVKSAYELRDEANRLLDEADALLHERLGLPAVATFEQRQAGALVTKVRAATLNLRFEASYHDSCVTEAEKHLHSLPIEVARLDDLRVTREIRAITKFRKRVYVPKGGIPLLSSKQLFQIDPIEYKGLAKGAHTKDLKEISLKENMIAVTCSGTIGRVQIIPRYMAGWTANQHATRLLAADEMNQGYLYAWLASDYGKALIKRQSYGSVILEIDKEMLGSVLIPLPGSTIQNEIGDIVLKANSLRNQAWELEREAIEQIENMVKI